MNKWNQLPSQAIIDKTIAALKDNNIDALSAETGKDAYKKVFEVLPEGAEVMNMTSVTLDTLAIPNQINESGKYNSVRNQLNSMNPETQNSQMQKLGAAPDWVIGSVHAVTQDGHVLIASNSASQLPAYAAGSNHVVWVVGAQKIVKNIEEGMKRIYEHSLALENKRVQKAYGMKESFVSKILIVNREARRGRTILILVNEVLGF